LENLPGPDANQWEYWKDNDVMMIGWVYEGQVGNLRKFRDVEALKKALVNAGDKKPGYAAKQLWSFFKRVKAGDIVLAYGRYSILDLGRVEGKYYLKIDKLYQDGWLYVKDGGFIGSA